MHVEMPFLKIDFSSHGSSNHIQKHLRIQFARYFRPVRLVLALLCCRIACLKQKDQRHRWLAVCHTAFIILFLIIALLISITQFWCGIRTNPPDVAVTILQLQGVLNLCFLIYWDRYSISDQLRQRLQTTSTGIGVLRRKTLLDNIHHGALIFGTITAIFMITYKILQIIANNYSPVVKISSNFNLPHYFHWFFVGIFVYVAISYPAIYVEVYSLISIICAEYRALSDDFANDCNSYQLPVIRHYITAHWTMSRAHALFHRSLSLWMSIHLSTSTLSCTYLLRSVLNLSHQLLALESVTVAVLVVITVAQIISSFVMCLSLCHDMTHFRCPLIALIAGTNALQEQAHSLAIAYINYLYRNSVGISFFEITIIDRKFVEKIVIVVLLITAMYHFNDSDKHLTDGCDEMISGS